jgi:hypothetical protein
VINISPKELGPLRVPAVVLLVAVVVAWVVVGYSQKDLDAAHQLMRARLAEAEEAKRRFHRSDEEKATILKYLPAYEQLQREGFVGPERRMDWLDALRAADRQAGLFGVNYEISAQEAYKGLEPGALIAKRMRHSTMQLRLVVTHEGDLLAFLSLLNARPGGMYSLRECALAPIDQSPPGPRKANLQAQCRIEWLTVADNEEPRT